MLRVRQQLGKYKIMRRLAEGGFANVFDAYDTIEGVRVALKVPHEQALNGSGREELLREVRLTAKLEHPNILSIKNAGVEGSHFVIAHRLGRESLADRLTRRIAPSAALKIADELLSAVAFAHQHRIVHRDIKPDNVILLDDGRACLCDFGIAKVALKTRVITEGGHGTLGYMAPEQALGQPSLRSDVFSLGLVLWRLFSGKLPEWPFEKPLPSQDRVKRLYGPELMGVLHRALEVSERKRYANAGQMLEAFRKSTRHAKRRASSAQKGSTKSKKAKSKKSSTTGNIKWKSQRQRETRRLVGTRLGAQTECRKCGGPVSEFMFHCPWCSTERARHVGPDKKAGPTKMPRQCRRCGRGMKADWNYCAFCYGPKTKDASEREYKDKAYVKRCQSPRCTRRVMLPFSRYCPWCQTKPKRPWTNLTGSKACKCCGWSVFPGFWDYCPWCGKPVEGGTRRQWASARHT